jgi:ATP-dependent helicase/nuclease subunit A
MTIDSNRYLDVSKSVIISSPAGSGKTEKLARRYIALLKDGSEVEKILCITFTEKAAAEMKQRILNILRQESPEMYSNIKSRIPLMRISTIHAFCLKVLKRFSIELGLDPSLSVMDELEAQVLWAQSVYEAMMAEKETSVDHVPESPAPSFESMIRDRGLKGWASLKRALDNLHARKPYPEMMLKQQYGQPASGEEARKLMHLYGKCLVRYKSKKAERHRLDFGDLEMLTFEALSGVPDWHNILYSFDEHTDHILVDEFQDTNTLQWMIIDRLTEEWRSGMGAKRDAGKTPTIFLVGDEKQSIYLFRGANVSVFHEARDRFSRWLGDEYHFIEAKENYRCLNEIVDFTNTLFERLMPKDPPHSWITRYSPFETTRKGNGLVELILLEAEENTKETRTNEALILAETIRYLHGRHEVYDGEQRRSCRFSDMAVLLRKRTHLSTFEDALRKYDIPFVVLKGIGFFEEPDVSILRETISFICDPTGSYSLFCLLRSPLFGLAERTLHRLLKGKEPLIEQLRKSGTKKLRAISAVVEEWLEKSKNTPLAVLLEQALLDTEGWSHFYERQRYANIKKFIALVEAFEAEGLSMLEIREKLLRQRGTREVSKANINAEGMDAVKIMTVHAAKGLQFPMVFLPSMEEKNQYGSGPVLLEESNEGPTFHFEEDRAKRDKDKHFRLRKMKEQEEEKRLLYVAVTRARDYLCMIGSRSGTKKPTGRLSYLEDAFDFMSSEAAQSPLPFNILTEDDLSVRSSGVKDKGVMLIETKTYVDLPSYTDPLQYVPSARWRDVTEETDIRVRHGQDWLLIGDIMHRLFEELSKGIIDESGIEKRAGLLLRTSGLMEKEPLQVIVDEIEKLKTHGLLDEIVLPRKDSHAELPFVLERGSDIYRGRIDRTIIREGTASVYDYKTFPLKNGEIDGLTGKYEFQMQTYKEAAERLFKLKGKAYLVFTHLPHVVEM